MTQLTYSLHLSDLACKSSETATSLWDVSAVAPLVVPSAGAEPLSDSIDRKTIIDRIWPIPQGIVSKQKQKEG